MLDNASRVKSKKALAAAARLRSSYQKLPVLDLRAKKLEVNFLLEELTKDSKRSFVMETANKPALLDEIVSSLTDWLSDIWKVAYEYKVEYEVAHECLLFVSNTLTRLNNIRTWSVSLILIRTDTDISPSCKCALVNMYIPVKLTSKSGRIVKTFQINGANRLEEATQFIWRDVFLSMLASGNENQKETLVRMLGDIEGVMGWSGIVRIWSGGKKRMFN